MEFPATRQKITSSGWRFLGGANCSGCKAVIEWWLAPDKTKHPLEAITAHSLRTHFESCPNAAEFRERKKKQATQQGKLFQ